METFGRRLARSRPPGRGLLVVELSGDLGAGKTTLARGFLHEAGVLRPVRSPTYTLVELYPLEDTTFLHLDLYRLEEPLELENLGLREWAQPGFLWLVEWPERGRGSLPQPDLCVTLRARPERHLIEVHARSAPGETWLARLEALEES